MVKYLTLFFALNAAACGPLSESDIPLDRQKLQVSDGDYLTSPDCWGGVGLRQEGKWIPVEWAVDNTEHFTRIGITSQTCTRKKTREFLEGIADVPVYFSASSDAEVFLFDARSLEGREDFQISSKVVTPLDTTSFSYSDNVIFFDGFMMLSLSERTTVQGKRIYSVVDIRK